MYQLNPDQAKAADQRSSVINELGKYIGTLTRAEQIVAGSGTMGIDFTFVLPDERRCRFTLYTEKKDGAVIKMGNGFVMAMMTVLGLRTIDTKPAKVRKWDPKTSAEIETTVPCYVDLMNRPIGLLLETEEYEKTAGGIGNKMVLAGVFQSNTELTASEVLDRKTTPTQLPKLVATLRHRPLTRSTQRRASSGGSSDMGHAGQDIPDDDIPF